jgi:hypothetical protein
MKIPCELLETPINLPVFIGQSAAKLTLSKKVQRLSKALLNKKLFR